MELAEVSELLNARHAVAKEKGWKEKPPSKSAFVKAVLEDNNLLRRPILIAGKKVAIGWNEAAIRALLE